MIKSMISYKAGDIVLVVFPFSDLQGQKRRLGLVLADEVNDVLLARLTTHAPRQVSDVALQHWATIGLPRSSTVRLTKLVTIDCRLVHHKIGHLHPEDAESVAQVWKRLTTIVTTELRKLVRPGKTG